MDEDNRCSARAQMEPAVKWDENIQFQYVTEKKSV